MNTKLATRIKTLRKIKGYTQIEFAELLGVGQTTVANYEKGIRVPDMEKLSRMASLFETTVDSLLGRDPIDESSDKKINIEEAHSIFLNHLLKGLKAEACEYMMKLYNDGANIKELYFNVLSRVLTEVGLLWEKGSIDVWKEHYISEVILDLMRELKGRRKNIITKPISILAFTSGPELHNIGLKMIADSLELEGFDVTYLGSNIPVQSIINVVKNKKFNLIAISVTMPYHIESTKNTINAIKDYFGTKAPKIIIGGNAFSNCNDVCRETNADFYGVNLDDIINILEQVGK